MVSGGDQRAYVALKREVGLYRSLDRLAYLWVSGVDQVAKLLADLPLPVGQRVDVIIDALIFVIDRR